VSFQYELAEHVEFGENHDNVIAVRVDNSKQPASRWYTGAGIYRHVRLVITDPIHIVPWGVFVTAPNVTAERAMVRVATEVENDSDTPREFTLQTHLIDPAGEHAAVFDSKQNAAPRSFQTIEHNVVVDNPQLWDLGRPQLYRAETRLSVGDRLVENVATEFGIRRAEFRAESGFWLNGRNLKIKGVCLHHDAGALGAAVPRMAWQRRLTKLRQLGVNAIRTAHNPPDPELLRLCDRLGILVMDEFFDCWTVGKVPFDYHLDFNQWSRIDARDVVRRDRNHPSVILYSVGNEIRDTPKAELAKRILAGLVDVCHETDPTRPVTQALFRPNVSGDYDTGLADMLDVIGTNYRDQELLQAWHDKPTRKIIGTEQSHERGTWLACRDHPQHAGQFLWAGIDYLGESRRWPVTTFNGGLLDRTGHPLPRALERQSWWSDDPMVYAVRRVAPTERTPTDPGYETTEWRRRQVLFADWTPRNLNLHVEHVEVYSNCEQVELLLNDNSLGVQPRPDDARPRVWEVQYESGLLTAIGRNAGQVVARHELHTAGPPARISLTSEVSALAPGWENVAYIEAKVVDEHGTRVPGAGNLVKFDVAGPGRIVAVDSGSIASHEPFQATRRHAFDGRCIAIVRATEPQGTIVVAAESEVLPPGNIRIETVPP
jgi:beta-galactosidase